MRRAISGALAALMLLAPLAEAKVLVVSSVPSSIGNETMPDRIALGVLNSFGVDYDYVRPGAMKTEWARTGVRAIGGPAGNTTQTYVGVIHLGFKAHANSGGYDPDSLTVAPRWPTVPQLYAGVFGMAGAAWTDDAAPCSTGIRSNEPPGANLNEANKLYLVGQPEVWSPTGLRGLFANQAAGGWYARGIWRPIVGYGTSASVHARDNVKVGCGDCDSLGRSVSPDSVMLWARYRSAAETAPLFFVDYGQFPNLADPALFAMAVAMLDSATGGRVITKKQKFAVSFDGLYRTGHYDLPANTPDTTYTGVFCAADSCDTLNIAATMDSLNSLRNTDGTRIPVTFSVDAESLAYVSMGYHRRLIRRVLNHRVAISSASGLKVNTNSTDTGREKLHDIFGAVRSRYILPGGTTSLPATCSATDTTWYCLLSEGKARADSVFPGRVSRVLVPINGDFTPPSITAANSMALDTLFWAARSLGFTGAVVSVMSNENIVGRTTIARGPKGWVSNGQRFVARKPIASNTTGAPTSNPPIGTFRLLPTRGHDLYSPRQKYIVGNPSVHDVYQEEAMGMWTGDWYPSHDPFHPNHAFEAHTQVIRMGVQTLGGAGQGTFAPRSGWWHVKWHVNRMRAINKLAGREVMRAVTLDEIAEENP